MLPMSRAENEAENAKEGERKGVGESFCVVSQLVVVEQDGGCEVKGAGVRSDYLTIGGLIRFSSVLLVSGV